MTAAVRGLWEREAESAAIAEAVGGAARGGSGVLLVEGPAGIGKTRLLALVKSLAAGVGAEVLSARGTQLERDFVFGVVRQLFEPLLAAAGPAQREALWQGPAVQARQVFAEIDAGAEPAGDLAVLHGLYWLTANACQNTPLVLAVDDLQWCDTPSLRYLAYLLPRLEDQSVLLAAALRTGERATDDHLVQQIAQDPAARVLRPHPLSAQATAQLLRQALPGAVAPPFAEACHEAAGGNPLLLSELARTLIVEDTEASAENVAMVRDLGSRAVARLVAARMIGLPESAVQLARAVAVLGGYADLPTTAAVLADQDTTAVLRAAEILQRLEILRIEQHGTDMFLAFVHPLVQSAVHDSVDYAGRAVAHRNAARALAAAGADPERVAAHLLHTPPAADRKVVAALRAAATAAALRGALAGAYTYLRRCLAEPPDADQRPQVLAEAGQAALQVDLQAATGHLEQALHAVADPAQRADIAASLGTAYAYLLDPEHALAVWSRGLERLPDTEEDRRRRIRADILGVATWVVPGRQDILGQVAALRELEPSDGTGARLLDCAIAGRDMARCDRSAVARASRALADGTLVQRAPGHATLSVGWNVLLAADDEHLAVESLDAAMRQAHHTGSLSALAPIYSLRACGWLWRGQLAEAEHDARQALRTAELSSVGVARYFPLVFLAESLTEQGRLDEAEQALHALGVTTAGPDTGPVYLALVALARLRRLQGDHDAALDTALRARQVCHAYDIQNPAVVGWRSQAALALHALDRAGEAREIAAEDLRLARQWAAPRALGRALRIAGLLAGTDQKLALLEEATTVLENSPARLEHAKALADQGAALRRVGHPAAAREPLRRALDLAIRCGASPVAERARAELAVAGGRPRHTALTGPDALTPSEQRVADLAATGSTNREIAQALFVTPKTVEVHLSAVYRKLGITARAQLPIALTTPGP